MRHTGTARRAPEKGEAGKNQRRLELMSRRQRGGQRIEKSWREA